MKLSPEIKSLLLEHDCVIIPEFGGLVCQEVPAAFNRNSHLFYLPNKHISFNRSLKNNDGLLANKLQQSRDLTYEDALSMIREEVVYWKTQLLKEERLVIEGVGTLYIDRSKKWRFRQDKNQNFNLNAFGLENIQLTPVQNEIEEKIYKGKALVKGSDNPDISKEGEKETRVISISAAQQPEPEDVVKKRKRWPYYMAAACLLPISFYSFWIPSQTSALNRGYVMASDFNPFRSEKIIPAQSETHYKERSLMDLPVTRVTENMDIEDKLVLDGHTYFITEKNTIKPKTIIPENSEPYHVIGGCFSKMSNAQNQIKFLTAAGFNASILDVKGGLHRVTAGGFKNAAEAKVTKIKLQNLGTSCWVLKK